MDKKPIDWTKPLRVVGTHERIGAVRIEDNGTIWVCGEYLPGGDQAYKVSREGVAHISVNQSRDVENVPPPPRIVKRWCVIRAMPDGEYFVTSALQTGRPIPFPLENLRVARVLIEEPDE